MLYIMLPEKIISNVKEDLISGAIDEKYYDELFNVLSQLTDAPKIPYITFMNYLRNLPSSHKIYVYRILNPDNDNDNDNPDSNNPDKKYKIVGTISLIIEQKLIHGGAKCGHIEDLVVSHEWRGQNIAQEMIEFSKDQCRISGCYKVILDCHERLERFYEKNGFKVAGTMMRYNILGP